MHPRKIEIELSYALGGPVGSERCQQRQVGDPKLDQINARNTVFVLNDFTGDWRQQVLIWWCLFIAQPPAGIVA